MGISTEPYDGVAAWAALDAETQAQIGALALEWAAASAVSGLAGPDDPAYRAAATAQSEARQALDGLFAQRCLEGGDAVIDGEHAYRVPSLLGPVCTGCGCSQDDACEGGCAWATETICTACADD